MQRETPKAIFANQALTARGWQRDVLITLENGRIKAITTSSTHAAGTLHYPLILPGLCDVHSHAFQRAMAGLTERTGGKADDNFWSWREVMYDFLGRFTPEDVERIARDLYMELLAHGYTSVGEFHYLHNNIDGSHYTNPSEMADAIVRAAASSGIHLTLLPVMYETSNFGGKPANAGQKRFTHAPDAFLKLMEKLAKQYGKSDAVRLGIAPHSLRAVPPQSLAMILDALPSLGLAGCPVHIHAAEQIKEVEDCLAWSGKRPVEWLLANHDINERWCFIHATHMNVAETKALAKSGAVAGLCPTTEANLGDGIFPAETYIKSGGRFAVGSDSNVCVSPFEELKTMEYAQRLSQRRRAILFEASPSVGRSLFEKAASGGAQALGVKSGVIAEGMRADLIAPDMSHSLLAGKTGDAVLDTLMFGLHPRMTDVFVAGRHVIHG